MCNIRKDMFLQLLEEQNTIHYRACNSVFSKTLQFYGANDVSQTDVAINLIISITLVV